MIFNQFAEDRKVRVFSLNSTFLSPYKEKQPNWGGLGYFTYKRSYARDLPGGGTEEWWQTCQRVVDGCFNIQKIHCRQMGLPWNEQKAQHSAQEMFRRLWDFKWTPPGRGLWVMGTDLVFERGSAALQNCAFTSSENIGDDFASPFVFLMDMSMLGVGVGGDTKGAGKARLSMPKTTTEPFVVQDSREGWVELVKTVLNSFVGRAQFPLVIDYSKVRGRGTPIKTFGGTASGPKPLHGLVESLTHLLLPEGVTATFSVKGEPDQSKLYLATTTFTGTGEPYRISSSQIVDIFNFVGKAVVAGGVRRCLPEGTLVHTSEGLLPIEKVDVGSSVMTSKGYSLVRDWVQQGVQPISRITTQMGGFECTDKHKIAVIADTKGGYIWKQAWELVPGDRMVFVDHAIEGTTTCLPGFKYEVPEHSTTCRDITIPELTPEVAWFFGMLAGDGYVRLEKGAGEVSIAVHADQGALRERAERGLAQFGVCVSTTAPTETDNSVKVRCKSKQLAQYLSQFKKPNEPLGVPSFVLQGSQDVRAAYVAGLSDADGCYRGRPMVVAASVYPSYLEQVQAVLASLGIPSRLRPHKDKSRASNGWQPIYHLNLVGEKAVRCFKDRVSKYLSKFEDNRETERSQNDYGFPSAMALADGVSGWKNGQMRWCRETRQITVATLEEVAERSVRLVPVEVFEVEHGVREAETYDISVEAGEFVAQGGYLVHNTAEIMFGEPDDIEFTTLKQDQVALNDRRWASNNSLFGYIGMDYTEAAKSMRVNGEPGIFWLDNARKYGRMNGVADNKDWRVGGCNPCFAGDTLIAVADGRGAVPIRQLVEEGSDVPVYSMDPQTGLIEIKMARNPRLTRENASLVEVVLDDDSSFRVTPDHKMVLLDGTQCEAQNLQPGDSLPRFQKRLERVKKDGKQYVRVYCNTRDQRKDKVFEHRLIAKFFESDKWSALYEETQQAGWVQGGLVVHHKDYNPLNNSPENLEILTFRDHAKLHGEVDNHGEKNPMWGRAHSAEAKKKIGQKTLDRCSDPSFLAKLSASHTTAEREAAAEQMSEQRRKELLAYYKEQEAKTDLETVWMGDRLYAVRSCEVCGDEFVVPWGRRGQSYCSLSCHNKVDDHIQKRKAGQAVAFADRQRQTLHDQVRVFKDLQGVFGRIPEKSEWETECRNQNVAFRLRKAGTTANPYALSSFGHLKELAETYNHRVKSVRFLDTTEPVYNLSVTDHHTVCVVTEGDGKGQCSGVVTFQCAEQSLEDRELCCLVETYPAHHDSYEDFEKTLKMAYLYAKTVTLVPTHDPRSNAVMMRNRRIGCSMSGIIQAMVKLGRRKFLTWCDQGYNYVQTLDRTYSDWLGIPLSIKTTSVKPSGCRPWYSLTSTNRGLLTLEDLFEHHPLDQEWAEQPNRELEALGSCQHITKTYNNGVSSVLRITTSYGIEVESTPNHQWWVAQRYDRNKKDHYIEVGAWRRADELQPGDILDIQPGIYNMEGGEALAPLNSLALNMRGDATEIQQPSEMNPRLAWLLGYLWGDGAMSPGKYRLRWVDARRENLLKAQAVLKEQFGLTAEIKQASEHRQAETLEIGSKHLWHWLIRNDVFKLYADKIDIIPKVVRASGQEDIIAFLAGLLDSDGWAGMTEQGAKLVWTTADGFFAKHIQDVALAVGLVLGRSHVTGGSSFQNHRSMYHLTQCAHVDPRGFEMLRRHSTKVAGVEARADFSGWHCLRGDEMTCGKLILGKVIKVEPIGEVPTYDIEVFGAHWYYAGAVRSHNTVSLLCGATPGIHYPHAEYYIRRVRVSNTSPLVEVVKRAGYPVEPDTYADDTAVVSFPVHDPHFVKGKDEVTIWEQFQNAADLQRHWADNQVSITISFKAHEARDIKACLEAFEDQLKAVSLLPLSEHGYVQAPYETITKERYEELMSRIIPMDLAVQTPAHDTDEVFCTNDSCALPPSLLAKMAAARK